MTSYQQLRTFWALLYRDLRFIIAGLGTRLIDGLVIVTMQTLVIGIFLPLLGMPKELIGPLFIGLITQIVFSSAYGIAFRQVNDLKKTKFINYLLALPLHKALLFGQMILAFMIEVAFVSLPLVVLGSIFLSAYVTIQGSFLAMASMYILALLLYATLFVFFIYHYDYSWFLDNIWARRLSPLFLFGCSYFPWQKLYTFNKGLAILMLCNPVTYVHEGLRSAFFGGTDFIPLWICMIATIVSCAGLMIWLKFTVARRLDPV